MDCDPKADKTLKELQDEFDEFLSKTAKFFGEQPPLTPEEKEENRLALAQTALLVEAENARRAKMTPEEREAEDAEEDRLCDEEEAEFEAILAQRDAEERGKNA